MTCLLLPFGLSLIVTLLGFIRYIWFISLGYGFSVAAVGAVSLLVWWGRLTLPTALACLLLTVYGLRLGGYLLLRERRSAAYNKVMARETSDGSHLTPAAKAGMWIGVSLLYALQVSPVLFRLSSGIPADALTVAGLLVMTLGIATEATADYQKSKAKKADPHRFCDKGLFRLVRCPNYLGEVLFWTGVLLFGLTALRGVLQILCALIGWACIVYIMFGGARRLELRQNRNYGEDPEYQAYVRSVPILLPFVPLYSVAKYKWLVG